MNRASQRPVRGTQLLVEHMGDVFKRPSLTALEILWRWVAGIPFLILFRQQAEKILTAYPLQSSGFYAIDKDNPWVATRQIAAVWSYYQPHVFAVLHWLLPAYAVAWAVVSGLGRNAVLVRMQPGVRWRPVSMIALQAAWVALFGLAIFGWVHSMQWAAAREIAIEGEPNLIGFFIWSIWIALAYFTLFALVSWVLSVAPILMQMENRSAVSALGQAFRLGKGFTSKLAEINLVMGIVKLALMVVALVFSAAPLPFSDEIGPDAMRAITEGAVVFYLVANDYFQVVRQRAFVEFWKVFRGRPVD